MNNQKINNFIEQLNTEEISRCPFPTGILTVNLRKLESNIAKITKFANKAGNNSDIKFLFPIKANAYGHGMIPIAKFIEHKKLCAYFGVAHLQEACDLRENGITSPILILGQSFYENKHIRYILQNNIEQEISDERLLYALNAEAKKQNKIANIHLSVDTGMGRCGVLYKDVFSFLDKIKECKNVQLKGAMTHFSVADENNSDSIKFTNEQIERFIKVKNIVTKNFSNEIIFHAANSGATIEHPASIFNMIRPGIATYGYPEHSLGISLEPIMELKTKISLIKKYPKGHTIGYGGTYKTQKENEYIGIVPIGYGDGLNRSLSNKLTLIINGREEKSIGRLSMDQFTVSVGNDTQIGDEVIIIGGSGKFSISARDIALKSNTITYEVLCNLGNAKRIQHQYIY